MKTPQFGKVILSVIFCGGVGRFCWGQPHALAVPTSTQWKAAFPTNANSVLDAAPKITLFSLYSRGLQTEYDELGPHPFHGFKVLGQTELRGQDKRQLLAHFYDAVAQRNKFRAACFAPHHGLRVQRNGKTVDLVICFTCGQFETHGLGPKTNAIIAKEGRAYFDAVLRQAKVPVQR